MCGFESQERCQRLRVAKNNNNPNLPHPDISACYIPWGGDRLIVPGIQNALTHSHGHLRKEDIRLRTSRPKD